MKADGKIKTCMIRYIVPVLLCIWFSASFSNVRASTETLEIEERIELISTSCHEIRIYKIPFKAHPKTSYLHQNTNHFPIPTVHGTITPLFLLYQTLLYYE